jgi:hypothetical protein
MMASIIDELMIKLGIDGKDAKKGMQDVSNSMDSFVNGMKGKLAGLTSAFAGLYAVQQTFSNYLQQGDQLLKFSRAMGLNVEEVDAWGQAVERSGGSAEGFQNSLKSLTLQLSKMATTGNSRAGKILESVGIDAGEVGRQRKAFDVLMDIADKMQGMSKEEAFGFGSSLGLGVGEITLLQQGRDGVAELVGKMKELGTITPDDTWLEDFNDSIADVKKSFMSLMGIVFRLFGPAMLQITTWVKQANIWLRQHAIAVKSFVVMLAGLITALLIPSMLQFFATIMANPITWVIMAIGLLALAIEDLIVWAEGGDSALAELWEAIFGSPQDAQATFEAVKQGFMDFVNFMQTDGKAIAEPFIELAKWLASLPMGNLMAIANFIKAIREGNIFDILIAGLQAFVTLVFGSLRLAINLIGTLLQAMVDAIVGFIQIAMATSSAIVQGYIQYLVSAFSSGVDSVIGFFVNLKDQIIALIGEAIDWAIGKLGELASKIASVPIIGGAIDLGVSAYNSITGGGNTTNNSSEVSVGTINVNTQSTDAYGIGRDIGRATRNAYSYQQANGGAY